MNALDWTVAGSRALQLVGIVAAGGAALGPWLAGSERGPFSGSLARAGHRLRAVAAGTLLAGLTAALAAQLVIFRDPFEPLLPQLQGLVLRTDWGRVWSLQAGGSLLLAALAFHLRPARPRGAGPGSTEPGHPRPLPWASWAILAALMAALPAFTGHSWAVSANRGATVATEVLHGLAASVWLGGLALLVLAGRGGPQGGIAGAVERFSALAMGAVTALVLTGGWATVVHAGGLGALLGSTDWGRALVLKLGLFAGMAALGAYNWQVTLPALRRSEAEGRFGSGAPLWEVLVGLAVLGVTAILSGLSPPGGD